MTRHAPFAEALIRARREQGFANGHAFHKARGGRKGLGMLYANYMALERGKSLPKPRRLQSILQALNLSEPSLQRRELVYAYLASVLGSTSLLADLEPSPIQSALSSEEVARQALRQRSTQLDLAQWTVLARDSAAYYSHNYLINTPGWSSLGEIAAAVKLPRSEVRAALADLAAAKIVARSGDRARSLLEYRFLRPLPQLPSTIALRAAILKKREAFTAGRGTLARRVTLSSRLTKVHLDRYFERLAETVRLFGVYGDAEKADDTDVYYLDARIFKIFD